MLRYSTRLVEMQSAPHASKRLYLESFLYHAMLHWPLRSRTEANFEELSGPMIYLQKLERWEKAFNDNFFLTTIDKRKKNKPKNFFALAKGTPGNDIIDLDSIKREWERMKRRKHVMRDNFWKEPFVRAKLLRLEGTVDGSGHIIKHKVEYPQHGSKDFRINTYYPCDRFSNRMVTFVLGFTWKGPTAFDVDEKGREDEVPNDGSDNEHKADEDDDWNDQESHRSATRGTGPDTATGAKTIANGDSKPARSKHYSKNIDSFKRSGIFDSENNQYENTEYGNRNTAVVTCGMSDTEFAEYSSTAPRNSTAGDSSLQFKSPKYTPTSITSNISDNSEPSPEVEEKSKTEGQERYTAYDHHLLTHSPSPPPSEELVERGENDVERAEDTSNTSPATVQLASGQTAATPDDSDVRGQTKKKGGQQKPIWKSQIKKRKPRKK